MENTEQFEKTVQNIEISCKNCGSPDVEKDYTLPLCWRCRDAFVHKPYPVWIKIVSVITLAIFVFALFRFPKSIEAGLGYEKAQNAENARKYVAAMREYQKVVNSYPNSTPSLARLFISLYHNGNINEALEVFRIIAGREEDDDKLVNEVNRIYDRIEKYYFPDENLVSIQEKVQNSSDEEKADAFGQYYRENPSSFIGAACYTDVLFDLKRFDEAEKITSKLIESDPEYIAGYLFLAAVCRETGRYDEGIAFCRKVLESNMESSDALVSISRIELKRRNDKSGLEYAQKAYELQSDDTFTVANLAMAYHFNNKPKERDEMIEKLKQLDDNEFELNRLKSVINGEITWRD